MITILNMLFFNNPHIKGSETCILSLLKNAVSSCTSISESLFCRHCMHKDLVKTDILPNMVVKRCTFGTHSTECAANRETAPKEATKGLDAIRCI